MMVTNNESTPEFIIREVKASNKEFQELAARFAILQRRCDERTNPLAENGIRTVEKGDTRAEGGLLDGNALDVAYGTEGSGECTAGFRSRRWTKCGF
jgi:hypothetical protein